MRGTRVVFQLVNHFNLFQDGPLRIEACSTGSNSMISKIVSMVSKTCFSNDSKLLLFHFCRMIIYYALLHLIIGPKQVYIKLLSFE